MKQKEITEAVENSFKVIDKLFRKILKEFNADDIHDFRVEVKKLRAFLRMAHINDENDNMVIPKLLKTFYGYIGIIRNIQLQKHRLFEYITKCSANTPHEYVDLLDKEKNYWQEEAIDLMADNNFDDVKEKIIKQLPGKIGKAQVLKFTQTKLNLLTTLIDSLHDDAEVHTIRKILKDLLYTWNYVQDKSVLPKAISNEEELKSITEILGCFRDICIEFEFLQPEYLGKIQTEDESKFLLEFYKSLQDKKKRITRKALHSLNALHDELLHSEIIINL